LSDKRLEEISLAFDSPPHQSTFPRDLPSPHPFSLVCTSPSGLQEVHRARSNGAPYRSRVRVSRDFRGLMERIYDIFEKMSDGTWVWRAVIAGREPALRKLQEMARRSTSEFQLKHIATDTIIAVANTPKG